MAIRTSFFSPEFFATETAGDAVVISINGTTYSGAKIGGIIWSYSATPTGGALTVDVDGDTVMSVDITSAGPGALYFPGEVKAKRDSTLTFTLAGVADVIGKLTLIGAGQE